MNETHRSPSLILWLATLVLLFAALLPASTFAQDTAAQNSAKEFADLRARVAKLEAAQGTDAANMDDEITRLKLGLQLPEPLGQTFTGLAPGASRVYFTPTPLAVGGFGEVHYTSESDGPRATNLARFVPYLGFRFSRNLVFNSAFEFESGGAGSSAPPSGAIRINHAYLDFFLGDPQNDFGFRVGNFPVPMGLVAYRSEPPQYLTVTRPRTERLIIPSTWNENGVVFFDRLEKVWLQAGIVNSGEALGYQQSTWIADGRQRGAQAKAEDFAWVARAEWFANDDGLIGASLYSGDSSQKNANLGRSQVFLGEIHGEVRVDRFWARALYAQGALSDTDRILSVTGKTIGSQAYGHYLVLAYDLLPSLSPIARSLVDQRPPPDWKHLPIFVSWERDDVYSEPTSGQPSSDAFKTDTYTIGVNYKPHPQVVIKADYAYSENGAGRIDRVVETAIGFVF